MFVMCPKCGNMFKARNESEIVCPRCKAKLKIINNEVVEVE